MKSKFTPRILSMTAGIILTLGCSPATIFAQSSSINNFTYQGRLNDTNGPANGIYDFSFALFPVSTGGSQIGTSVTHTFLPVTNGLFTIPLEFLDATSFSGADRWLEIAVHPSGVGTNITLSPRQQVTAAPYAIHAGNAATATTAGSAGSVAATNITGTMTDALLSTNVALRAGGNSFTGNQTVTGGSLQVRGNGVDDAALFTAGNSDFSHLLALFPGRLNDPNPFVLWKDGDPLRFATDKSGFSELMRIAPGGNVGIGTADPQGSLHLYSTNNPTVMRIQSTGMPGFGRLEFISNPQGEVNEWRPGYIQSTDAGGFTGGLAFIVNGTGAANKFGTNEVMRIVNGGVGINTANPNGAALAVNGDVTVEGTIYANGISAASVTTPQVITAEVITPKISTSGNVPLELNVNGQRVMRMEYATNSLHGSSPNLVGGYSGNMVSNGIVGAFIGGGGGGNSVGPNRVGADYSSVLGGYGNTASGYYSTAMGFETTASAIYSTAMGSSTTASDYCSTAMGYFTTASGPISTALGYFAQAAHAGSFVWADSSSFSYTSSTTNNSVTFRAAGGYRLFSNPGMTAGVSLAPGGTAWAVISDRNAKKDFAPVDTVGVLEKLAAMPVTQWHYKWEDASVTPHIGPMAQDFKAAFYPGTDDKSITTQEADGVTLAAIQGLNQKLEAQRAANEELKQQVAELKQLVQTLAAKHKSF